MLETVTCDRISRSVSEFVGVRQSLVRIIEIGRRNRKRRKKNNMGSENKRSVK
jgi:hypothetical protein